ncbi:M4 family metallopeptidase [Candidatus Protochlamydia sp. R18]|uniref:M4 family metallopeptidase n=1 Tax=Candidatus Protochlamydia sp. R18 TaxID=1353977 RepID=UPI0005A9643C|nr:M4 family metallopeptidase [Candidatus Protochlamydia sp. R18]
MEPSSFFSRQDYYSFSQTYAQLNPATEQIESDYAIEWSYPNPDIKIFSVINGQEICTNNQCETSTNPIAAELYKTVVEVYAFFERVFKLRGIDDQGTVTNLHINWQERNAEWSCPSLNINEVCWFTFNDAYAVTKEIVAHAYFHAILHNKLNYRGESGALEESLADVFGIAFKHWLIDEQILEGPKNWWMGSFRNLSIPSSMQQYQEDLNKQGFPIYKKENDYGYVHKNSCIPNHAFYLVCQSEGGKTWGIIAQIWFKASQDRTLESNETFETFANRTIEKATEFGMDRIVFQAWLDVGVLSTASENNEYDEEIEENQFQSPEHRR